MAALAGLRGWHCQFESRIGFDWRTRAPNRYALLVKKHQNPDRAAEIDKELEQRQKGRGRDGT